MIAKLRISPTEHTSSSGDLQSAWSFPYLTAQMYAPGEDTYFAKQDWVENFSAAS